MIIFRLKEVLAEKGYSITSFSQKSGISRPTLSALVNNESKGIQFDTLDTICKTLYIPINKLITHIPFSFDAELLNFDEELYFIKIILYIDGIQYNIQAKIDIDLSSDKSAPNGYLLCIFTFTNMLDYLLYQNFISKIDNDTLHVFKGKISDKIIDIIKNNVPESSSMPIEYSFENLNRIDSDKVIADKMLTILNIQHDIESNQI